MLSINSLLERVTKERLEMKNKAEAKLAAVILLLTMVSVTLSITHGSVLVKNTSYCCHMVHVSVSVIFHLHNAFLFTRHTHPLLFRRTLWTCQLFFPLPDCFALTKPSFMSEGDFIVDECDMKL